MKKEQVKMFRKNKNIRYPMIVNISNSCYAYEHGAIGITKEDVCSTTMLL